MGVKKPMTNEKLVLHAMNYSKYGALSQAFIMQALEKYAEMVISEKQALIDDYEKNCAEGKFQFVNMHAWVGCAEELKELFENRRTF